MNDLYVMGAVCSRNKLNNVIKRLLDKLGVTAGLRLRSSVLSLATIKILFCVCLAHAGQRGVGNPAAAGVALSTDSIKPLQIGDTIPDALWNMPLQMVKAGQKGSTTVTLSDYKGKLIILDFWATWCTACVAAMPKLDCLNRQFGDKVKILPVSYEEQQLVRPFIANNSYLKDLQLSSIVNRPIALKEFFPHKILPHIVWIDRHGKVLALSSSEEVTTYNIKEAITQNEINITFKEDMDINQPLFMGSGFPAKLSLEKYAIVVKGKVEGLPVGARSRTVGGIQYGQAFFNNSLLRIYTVLGRHLIDSFNGKSFLFKIDDDDPLFIDEAKAEKYTVDFQLPKSDAGVLYTLLLEELNYATPYHASIAEVKTECLILKYKKAGAGMLKTKGGELLKVFNSENGGISLQNASFILLVKWLNSGKTLPPVINESGIDYKIDINLAFNADNLEEIKSELTKYGLELTEEKRYLKKLVITKK